MDAENFATRTYFYTMVTTRKIFWSYIFGHMQQIGGWSRDEINGL